MSKFPLIENELALTIEEKENGTMRVDYFVRAADLERLLSQARVAWIVEDEHLKTIHLSQPVDATHTARLIGVKPIKKDTVESLLRDWLEKFEAGHDFDMSPYMNRAKKLLEGKE